MHLDYDHYKEIFFPRYDNLSSTCDGTKDHDCHVGNETDLYKVLDFHLNNYFTDELTFSPLKYYRWISYEDRIYYHTIR